MKTRLFVLYVKWCVAFKVCFIALICWSSLIVFSLWEIFVASFTCRIKPKWWDCNRDVNFCIVSGLIRSENSAAALIIVTKYVVRFIVAYLSNGLWFWLILYLTISRTLRKMTLAELRSIEQAKIKCTQRVRSVNLLAFCMEKISLAWSCLISFSSDPSDWMWASRTFVTGQMLSHVYWKHYGIFF